VWKQSKRNHFGEVGGNQPADKRRSQEEVPGVIQKVAMTREGNYAPVNITGAPLVIEFSKSFLQPAFAR
jgi:hypothetical protein